MTVLFNTLDLSLIFILDLMDLLLFLLNHSFLLHNDSLKSHHNVILRLNEKCIFRATQWLIHHWFLGWWGCSQWGVIRKFIDRNILSFIVHLVSSIKNLDKLLLQLLLFIMRHFKFFKKFNLLSLKLFIVLWERF